MTTDRVWKRKSKKINSSDLIKLPLELKYQIISYLPPSGVSAVAKSCQQWYSIGNKTLYENDAKHHNSSAIIWAAGKCEDEDTAMRIIKLAKQFGGDVTAVVHRESAYTTPLHLAAARRKRHIVEWLVSNGASVKSLSRGFSHFTKYAAQCLQKLGESRSDLRRRRASGAEWLPLLVPMVKQDWTTAEFFLNKGAPAQVMVAGESEGQVSPFDSTVNLTVLHLAAMDPEMPEDMMQKCVCNFKSHINDQHIKTGDTALTLALLAKNELMTSILLRAGADVNVRTFAGRTALFLTIDEVFLHEDSNQRKWCIELIDRLLDKGAHAAAFNSLDELSTPLIGTMRQALSDDPQMMKQRRQIIDRLIEHGAAVDMRAVGSGNTAVQSLVLEIIKRETLPMSFVLLLEDMVEKYGANLNLPVGDESSILGTVLRRKLAFRSKLVKILLKLGAKIFASEASWVFQQWMYDKKSRIEECIVLERKHTVPQEDIDRAYLHTFDGRWNKEYTWLRKHFPVWKNGNQILAQWILHQGAKLDELQLELGFDPTWVDEDGRSFLHLIVTRLLDTDDEANKINYTEKQAVKDTKKLISMGMSVCVYDNAGLRAIHRLRMSEVEYDALELLLLRREDIERGEYFRDSRNPLAAQAS